MEIVLNLIGLVLFFSLVCIVTFFQFPILVWTIVLAVGLIAITLFLPISFIFIFILSALYLAAAAFANLHRLRRQHIVKPMLSKLQKQLPSISRTEREALEAGNTWWEKELFCGQPDWQRLLRFPAPVLTDDEQQFLDEKVDALCALINDWQIVHEKKDLPEEVWNYLKHERFLGMAIPKEYGGLGFSAVAHSCVIVKIATKSISAAVTTMVPNSLGPAELLIHYGTEAQKNYYLPRLARGEEIPCFALTAPEAGSDAGSIPDTGIVCQQIYQGKDTIGIRLTWDKRYITLAPVATVLGLAFQLYDPENLLGKGTQLGITLCLLPTTHPGVEVGNRHLPMYQGFMNGPTRGKDVFVPVDWIIGGVDMAGQGWRMLMECLSIGRSISLPALATACGKIAYRYTGAYAKVRKQFNTAIANFEGIEEALGYIAGYSYLLEAARLMTAGAVDLQIKPSTASAIAKYHMTELSRKVMNHAMDVHAGHTVQVGPRNFLANVYMAIPISITVEGANILTRNLIIFGQGAIRCHPYLLQEIALISAPQPDLEKLDQTLLAHIGFLMRNVLRTFVYGLTGGLFIFVPIKNPRVKKAMKQLTRMSAALAFLSDVSLILLGGSLKRRERISARLGDILSQLYMTSAVIKFYVNNGKQSEEEDYVCWAITQALFNIQQAINELLNNYPKKWLGKLMQWVVFPFGNAYQAPSDQLHKKLLATMLVPSSVRDRITQYTYINQDQSDLTYQLDRALPLVSQIEPIAKKLQKAVKAKQIAAQLNFIERLAAAEKLGILTQQESQLLADYDHLQTDIIKVNEFTYDLSNVIT